MRSKLKKSFQGKIYEAVNSRLLCAGLFSFVLLSFLFLLFPSDVFSGQVTLTWNAPSTNADGTPITYFTGDYRIYSGTVSGNYSRVTNLSSSNSIVTGQVASLTNGQTYYFVVTAVNKLGNESNRSNEISKTAQSGTTATYTITASAGANGTISPSGITTVNGGTTTWFSVTPNTGYHITAISGCGGSDPGDQAYGTTYIFTTGLIAANCAVTASFAINTYTQNQLVLRLSGAAEPYTETWYFSIQDAYDASSDTDEILTPTTDFYENLIIDRGKSIMLEGGYSADFNSVTGFTTVHGAMTIGPGAVSFHNVILQFSQ